jgi:hypothetical protein
MSATCSFVSSICHTHAHTHKRAMRMYVCMCAHTLKEPYVGWHSCMYLLNARESSFVKKVFFKELFCYQTVTQPPLPRLFFSSFLIPCSLHVHRDHAGKYRGKAAALMRGERCMQRIQRTGTITGTWQP